MGAKHSSWKGYALLNSTLIKLSLSVFFFSSTVLLTSLSGPLNSGKKMFLHHLCHLCTLFQWMISENIRYARQNASVLCSDEMVVLGAFVRWGGVRTVHLWDGEHAQTVNGAPADM